MPSASETRGAARTSSAFESSGALLGVCMPSSASETSGALLGPSEDRLLGT